MYGTSSISPRDLPSDLPYLRKTKYMKIKADKLDKHSQNFFELREKCLKSGDLFEDPKFPIRDGWKRPTELESVNNPEFIVGEISRSDIKQGKLEDCWFLAALTSLTLHPELMRRVVPSGQSFDENYAGIFHFQFWYYGKWVDIVVDDRLPVLEGRLAFNHSLETNEFWSALLEKAFAKLYGSYEALKGGLPGEAMENLTGGIVERYLLNDLKTTIDLFEILRKSFESYTIIACGIFSNELNIRERKLLGLVEGHAYSITAAIRLSTPSVNLVRVRNPWGIEDQWRGPWSDRSSEWGGVPEAEKKSNGEFWMSYQDFKKYFNIVEICHLSLEQGIDRKWKEIYLEGKWEGRRAGGNRAHPTTYQKNPHFKLKFTTEDNQKKNLIIALIQKNTREENKKCLKIGFDVYKFREPNNRRSTLNSNKPGQQFLGFREECDRFDLDSGTYSIVVCTEKPDEEGEFLLRILSESGSTVEILEPKEKIIYKRGAKSFEKFCGPDGEMDSSQLQELLKFKQWRNKLLHIPKSLNPNFGTIMFSEQLCRVLVNGFDTICSGKLNRNEFICLWRDILKWKEVFEKRRTGWGLKMPPYELRDWWKLSPHQLRKALHSIGVPLLDEDFNKLVNGNKMIDFGTSLIYAFQLQMDDVPGRVADTSDSNAFLSERLS